MAPQPSPTTLPSEETIRKLAGRELDSNVAIHIFEGRSGPRTVSTWSLDDAREAEELVIRKLGLPAYAGALTALLGGDANKAIIASPQHRLRACLLALKRDAEETGG